MKIRVSFEVDVTNAHMINGDPITKDNAKEWYEIAFDVDESNYTNGFITNTKVEVIPNT